jgi:hypothetical protein
MARSQSYIPSKLKDGYKIKANVEEVYFITLDFDKNIPTLEEFQGMGKEFRFSWFLHTTISHQKPKLDQKGNTLESPIDRYRVIIPYSYPVSLEEHLGMKQFWIEKFPDIDSTCFDGNRYFKMNPDAETSMHNFTDDFGKIVFLDPGEILKRVKDNNQLRQIKAAEKKIKLDDTIRLKNNGQIKVGDVQEKLEIFCPFCDPKNRNNPDKANAFININENGKYYIFCSSEAKTYWQENDYSDETLESTCSNYFSYQAKVNEAAIVGDKFFLESIGSDKFLIRVGANGKEEKKIYYDYLVKRRHIQGLRRIDYIGDISLNRSEYTANLPEGIITVKIKGIDEKVRDNEFIESYLQRTFGGYKDFIKQWLAVYCYTNYQDLPTLILTGPRGTGKNTFAEMIYEIFPTLSAIAKDISGSFNPNAESKLLIIDESDSKGKVQYQTLKSMSGSKYVEVNKKYVPQYQVWNNLNIIFMSNEDLPIHVERDEMPTDEANNQFFVYSMKPFQGIIDPDLDKKLNERIGYYIRTELKAVFEGLDFSGYRYSIRVPITEDEKKLFENSMSEEEILAETIIDDMEKCAGLGFWEYAEFVKKGFIPSEYIDDKLSLKIQMKHKVIG